MIADYVLYLIAFVSTLWILTTLLQLWSSENSSDKKSGLVAVSVFFGLILLLWWWATITVVGPLV